MPARCAGLDLEQHLAAFAGLFSRPLRACAAGSSLRVFAIDL
jgi:hypothetical protein